jgi:hypothetical protein
MARASWELVTALRTTAARLQSGARYAWTHMGACNCGHLAQTLTARSADELRRIALEKRGEWAEQALEWCPGSGYPIDHVIATMLAIGLERRDIAELEKLANPEVLRRLPLAMRRSLSYRERDHVVAYLHAFADLLEEALPDPPALAAE